jgi:hypothetical protein
MEKTKGEWGYHCSATEIRSLSKKMSSGTEPKVMNDAAVTSPFIAELLCAGVAREREG